MIKRILMCSFCGMGGVSAITLLTESYFFGTEVTIPDNDLVGIARTEMVLGQINKIESIEVGLQITGGWYGDLYGYLTHGSGFVVLLNRPGLSIDFPDGSSGAGMDLIFDDAASEEVHTAMPMSGMARGRFQPDGREEDPRSSLDPSPRTTSLQNFRGLDPRGEWTLFLADVGLGEEATLTGWSLTITGIPEPSSVFLLGLGCCLQGIRRRR